MGPEQPGRHGTAGAERFAQGQHCRLAGSFRQGEQVVGCCLQGYITPGPDVCALQHRKQIDIRRPGANARKGNQRLVGRSIIQALKACEIQCTGLRSFGQSVKAFSLCAGETQCNQFRLGTGENGMGCRRFQIAAAAAKDRNCSVTICKSASRPPLACRMEGMPWAFTTVLKRGSRRQSMRTALARDPSSNFGCCNMLLRC
jgi:hypothetical protein